MKGRMHSFANRVSLRIILVWLVMMAIIDGIVFVIVERGVSLQSRAHYEDTLELTDEKIGTVLKAVEISAVNMREGLERSLFRKDDVYAALERELGLNTELAGCAVAMVPDYFPEQGRWFEPYVIRLEDGSFEHRQIGSQSHDYFQSLWYTAAINREEGYWSDPYFDDAGALQMLCTYSLPLHDEEGTVIGVFGADVTLEWLAEQVREIDRKANERSIVPPDPGKEAYSFILGRNGGYIAHPDAKRILATDYFRYYDPVLSRGDSTYVRIGRRMLAGERGMERSMVDGVESFVYFAPLDWIGWSVGIVVPKDTMLTPGLLLGLLILGMMVFGMLAVLLVSYLAIRRAAKPLQSLAASAGEVAKGNFDTPLPQLRYNDEIRLLRDSFANMETSLSAYVDQLTAATAQKASMESELSIAREIQMSMLPKAFPPDTERADVDLYGQLTPAKAVGGDFYDFHIQDDRLYFCIGDVSGKGVPAALIMSVTSTLFRSLSVSEEAPEKIISAINASTEGRNDSLMFVTLFVGILDLSTGVLSYCNAGHNAPVVIGRELRFLEVEPNVPVGVMDGWAYKGQQITFAPGTSLFLYTDGLTEATDGWETLFGEDRVLDALRKMDAHAAPATVIEGMSSAVHDFVGEAEQSDDLTMLLIRYNGL